MATYTVTRVITRPNTSTQWPHEVHGRSGYDDISEKVSKTISYSADELIQTIVFVWASKEDFIALAKRGSETRDGKLNTKQNEFNTYMAANNITSKVTDASASTEDAILEFHVQEAGSSSTVIQIKGDGIHITSGNKITFADGTSMSTAPAASNSVTMAIALG